MCPLTGLHAAARHEFESDDPHRIEAYLGALFETRSARAGQELGATCRVSGVDVGAFTIHRCRMPGSLAFRTDPFSRWVIGHLQQGRAERTLNGRAELTHDMSSGDVLLGIQPGQSVVARTDDSCLVSVLIEPAVLYHVAGSIPTRPTAALRFTGYRPVSASAARQWINTYEYVEQLLDTPDAAAHPLLLGSAARLLAAAALATFPNTMSTDATSQDRRDATDTTLDRAVAFIESNPDQDISVADIAEAACVTVRAVQLAFRRHLNTTPMVHLRRVRLGLAHQDLLDADPRQATVAAVANRWGFTSHSRFAALYRSVYYVPPSSTLNGSRPDRP